MPVTRPPVARMQYIYEKIRTERRPNCSTLAKALEVSPKTVQRDIDFMRYQMVLPIEYDPLRHGFYFEGKVGAFPSLKITEAELVALCVARKAVEQYAGTPFQKPLASAFEKLSQGLENELTFNWQEVDGEALFRPLGLATQDLKVFEQAAIAVRQRRELEFEYRKLNTAMGVDRSGKAELRRVQPFSLLCAAGQWYLRGHDLVRRELRTFHLGRMSKARILPHSFKRPEGFDVSESFMDSIGIYEGAHVEPVQLRFTGWAARVAAERIWHWSQKMRHSKRDESLEMTLKVALTPELERWLWSWGDSVEVIKPVELRERLGNVHQRASAVNR
jgi:predicted DNA-binding transcriptional regulator YafY